MNGTCGSNPEPSRFRSCPTRPTTPPERGRSLTASVLSIRSAMLRTHGTPQLPISPPTPARRWMSGPNHASFALMSNANRPSTPADRSPPAIVDAASPNPMKPILTAASRDRPPDGGRYGCRCRVRLQPDVSPVEHRQSVVVDLSAPLADDDCRDAVADQVRHGHRLAHEAVDAENQRDAGNWKVARR